MYTKKAKRIGCGNTARIESWFDSEHRKELYKVIVGRQGGSSLTLPSRLIDGTREKVEKIYKAITAKDTFDTVFNKMDELDKL